MSSRYMEFKLGSSTLPVGDPIEQFIANLMLSISALHANDVDAARKHLSQAHSIATSLERKAQTHRGVKKAKVIDLIFGENDDQDILMMPVVGECLIVPMFDMQRIVENMRSFPDEQSRNSLRTLEISYYNTRLRPARLKEHLHSIMNLEQHDITIPRIEALLSTCLVGKNRSVDYLDLSNDYLDLTRDFLLMENFPIAGLTLEQASRTVEEFVSRNKDYGDMQSVINFRAKVEIFARELRASSS
jgi:hypothetical protein